MIKNEFPEIDYNKKKIINEITNKIIEDEDLVSYLDLDKFSLETFRFGLEKGIKEAFKKETDLLEQYFRLSNYSFFEKIIDDKKLLSSFILGRLKKGKTIPLFLYNFGSFEPLKKAKENQKLIKKNLKQILDQDFKNNIALSSFETLKELKEEIREDEKFLKKELNKIIFQKKRIPKSLIFFSEPQKFQEVLFDNVLNLFKKSLNKNESEKDVYLDNDYFDLLPEARIYSLFNVLDLDLYSFIEKEYLKKGKFFPKQFFYLISKNYLSQNKELMKDWFSNAILNSYKLRKDFLSLISNEDLQILLKKGIKSFIYNRSNFPFEYLELLFLDNLKDLQVEDEREIYLAISNFINSNLDIPNSYLALASDNNLRMIKENYADFLKNKIKENILKDFSIPSGYKIMAFKDILQEVLDDKEFIKKVVKKYIIVDIINFSQSFLNLIQPEILEEFKYDKQNQEFIKDNIKKALRFGFYLDQKYINLALPETLEEIKKDKELIKEGLKTMIVRKMDQSINNYAALLSKEDFDGTLKEAIKYCILNNLDISFSNLPYITSETIDEIKKDKNLQAEIKEIIKKELLIPQSISFIYFYLASSETIEEIKNNKECQLIINEMIKKSLAYNLSLSDYYSELVSENVLDSLRKDSSFQDNLKERIKRNLIDERNFDLSYFNFLSSETKNALQKDFKFQEFVKKEIYQRIIKGYSFYNFYELLSDKNKKEFFEHKNLEKLVKDSVLQAFSFESDKEKQEVEKIINNIVKNLSLDYLKRAIIDRTFLPVGLKIHFKKAQPVLNKYLKPTGGFIAHQYQETFIVPPFSNLQVLELFLLSFEKLCKEKNIFLREKEKMYYQACFPERLNNEMCGILSLSFLLEKKAYINYNEDIIKHNQNAIGLTIYDAGNVVSKEHFVFLEYKSRSILRVNGRTDLLLCSDMDDLQLAVIVYNMIFAYLNKNSYFHKLGQQFIEFMKDVLKRHNKEYWLNNKFIGLSLFNEKEIKNLGDLLMEVTEIRKDYNRKVEIYNQQKDFLLNTQPNTLNQMHDEINKNIVREIKEATEEFYLNFIINPLVEIDI